MGPWRGGERVSGPREWAGVQNCPLCPWLTQGPTGGRAGCGVQARESPRPQKEPHEWGPEHLVLGLLACSLAKSKRVGVGGFSLLLEPSCTCPRLPPAGSQPCATRKGCRRGGWGSRPGAQGLGVMQQLCPRAWPQTSPPSASRVATCQLPAVTPKFRIEGLLLGPTSGKSHLSLLQEPVCTQRDGALPGEGTVSLNLGPTPRHPSLCTACSQKESSEFQNSGSVPLEWPHSGLK